MTVISYTTTQGIYQRIMGDSTSGEFDKYGVRISGERRAGELPVIYLSGEDHALKEAKKQLGLQR